MLFRMDGACFPPVTGEALDGTPFGPTDGSGTRTVALIGFGIEQRSELEAWGPAVESLVRSQPDVRARLFVVLKPKPKVMRAMVLAGLRKAVTAPELRAATIVVFTDPDAFCASLGIGDPSHPAVVVLDEAGRVVWRALGAFSLAAGTSLAAAAAG
jgi:hypothetical protein